MKLSQITKSDMPILVSRKGCKIKEITNLPAVESFEISVNKFPIGTIIEFPTTLEDMHLIDVARPLRRWNPNRQSRRPNGQFGPLGCYEMHEIWTTRILVLVNSKLRWIVVRSLFLPHWQPISQKHSFQKKLMEYHDDSQRLQYLIGKTVEVTNKKKYWRPVFTEDGILTNKHVRREYSILREVH